MITIARNCAVWGTRSGETPHYKPLQNARFMSNKDLSMN